MLTLPQQFSEILQMFAVHFSPQVWEHARVLLTGAILVRGQRTVASALRVMGLGDESRFEAYHRVLSRAVWDARTLGRTLLILLLKTFALQGELLIGGDETIERRTGKMIRAKGIYRDPVRSSKSHFVKASGLRWVTMMLLINIPFAKRVWALPFLTLLAPSERFYGARRPSKTIIDWMRQGLLQVRRWLPDRKIVFVGDSAYAALELLARMTSLHNPITMVTRLRLDAALYEPARKRLPGQLGRTRVKGARLPTLASTAADANTVWRPVTVAYWYGELNRTIQIASATAVWYHSGMVPVAIRYVLIQDPLGSFETQALLCTDPNATARQIIDWFVRRWQMESTHRDAREHLGVETQRQWSDLAIARTTPILFGLYSLITVFAHHLHRRGHLLVRRTAWYDKPLPTFSDAIAAVRYVLWRDPAFHTSNSNADIVFLPIAIFDRFAAALCFNT